MASDWFEEGVAGNAVQISELLTAPVLDLVISVLEAGALISFGKSSDGGAIGITVTSNGKWRRNWFHDGEQIEHFLLGAATWLTTASSAQRQRPRERGSRGG